MGWQHLVHSVYRRLRAVFSGESQEHHAHAVYITAVERARQPVFYTDFGFPDSVLGRFEVIVLHVFLILHRLKQFETEEAHAFGQCVMETYCRDMDRNLREMGLGDTGVSKRVKAMARGLYGRLQAYEQALAASPADATTNTATTAEDPLCAELRANAYAHTAEVNAHKLQAMAAYIRTNTAHLRHYSQEDMLANRFHFAALDSALPNAA